MVKHRPGYIIVILVTLLFLCASVVLNYLASYEEFKTIVPGMYLSNIGDITDKYVLEITPSSWTFSVWIVIYLYQFLWMAYGLSTLCRKSNDWHGYLYYRPDFMPISLYVFFAINMILNVAWVFIWDREILVASCPLLFSVALTLYICLAISYYALDKKGATLLQMGHAREIILVRGFVHNGLSMYCAWTSIATLLNLGVILVDVVDMGQEDVGSIILGIIGLLLIIFSILDILVLDKWTRYTFTPYIVLIVALYGSMDKNWCPGRRNFILTAVLLGHASLAFLYKICFVIKRSCKKPEPIALQVLV